MSGTKQNERGQRWGAEDGGNKMVPFVPGGMPPRLSRMGRSGALVSVEWTEDPGRSPLDDLRMEKKRCETAGAQLFPDTLALLVGALATGEAPPRPTWNGMPFPEGQVSVDPAHGPDLTFFQHTAVAPDGTRHFIAIEASAGIHEWFSECHASTLPAPCSGTLELGSGLRQRYVVVCGGDSPRVVGERVDREITAMLSDAAPLEIRTPEEADRLLGRDSGLGQWMREGAGWTRGQSAIHVVAPPSDSFSLADVRAARATLDAAPHPKPMPLIVPPAMLARMRALGVGEEDVMSTRLLSEGMANPLPAPRHVWLPPPSACPAGWCEPDGTLTISSVSSERVCFEAISTGSGPGGVGLPALTASVGGWRCIGVATPRGRVMVGDGFADAPDEEDPIRATVAAITTIRCETLGGGMDVLGVVVRLGSGECYTWEVDDLFASFMRRTHYAPARVGERYRDRLIPGRVAEIDVWLRDGVLLAFLRDGAAHSGPLMDLPADGRMPVEQWERLDPGPASDKAPLVLPVIDRDGWRAEVRNGKVDISRGGEPDRYVICVTASSGRRFMDPMVDGVVTPAERPQSMGEAEAFLGFCQAGVASELAPVLGDEAVERKNMAALHASFAAAGLGPVETLAREGRIAVYLTASPADAMDRVKLLLREWSGVVVHHGEACPGLGESDGTHFSGRKPVQYRFTLTGAGSTAAAFRAIEQQATQAAEAIGGVVHLSASPSDLRALHDAIGRAFELPGPQCLASFGGSGPLTVLLDPLLFSPVVHTGPPASLRGDRHALVALRVAVAIAMSDGRAEVPEWGKGQRLLVTREGPVGGAVVQPDAARAPTLYRSEGGPGGWRWGGASE